MCLWFLLNNTLIKNLKIDDTDRADEKKKNSNQDTSAGPHFK